MRRIWFFRHCESLANTGEATTTPAEIPLSEKGLLQADILGESVDARPDIIVVSPYLRTQQTANPVILRFSDVPVVTMQVQEFTYLSISRCRGSSQADRKPMVEEYWRRCDPNYADGDQAESFAEFMFRIGRAMIDLIDNGADLTFVYTHEQFIKGMIWAEMGLFPMVTADSMKGFDGFSRAFKIANATRMEVVIDSDRSLYFGKLQEMVPAENDRT